MSGSQLVMLALAIGGLTILMISTYRRTSERQSRPRVPVRERYAELQRESGARRDLDQVMIELDELARQIHGRIDTRVAKLEAVIRDADNRIEKLGRLIRAAKGDATIDITLQDDAPHSPVFSAPAESHERHATIYRWADAGLSPADIGQKVGKTAGEVELVLALRRTRTEADRTAWAEPTSTRP